MENKAWLWRRKSLEQEKEKTLELERHVEELKGLLSLSRVESKVKDDLLAKQLNEIKEATADRERAKNEVALLRKEIVITIDQKSSMEEKNSTLETILKECKKELHDLEEKQQQTIHDMSTKITKEEQNALLMENRLIESNNKLTKLEVENNKLSMILEGKEKSVNDLIESNYQLEARFTTLMELQDFLDKDNTSLKYEIQMLKRENIRLDSECQKLHVMVRKKLPAISKMKNDVVVADNVSIGSPRKNQILALEYQDSPNKRVASLIERLNIVEDENRILKKTIVKKNEELQFTKTSSEENSKLQVKMGVSELSLMDDFIEMEKLAIVCVDKEPWHNNKQRFLSDLEKPLCKIIEMIEGVLQKSFTYIIDQQISGDKDDKSVSTSTQTAHVFHWEVSEFCSVLQKIIVVCNDLLNGTVDFNAFIIELGSSFEWITSHCSHLEEVNPMSDINNASDFKDLQSRNELLSTQLKEANLSIENLEKELLNQKCSKNLIEDQIESQRSIAEELGTQLTVANSELNFARKKISSLDVEFDFKSNYCDELEATCLELQLQLESMSQIGTPSCHKGQEKNSLSTDCEISAVSEKLAECQATMLNLGKQLKSLASSNDAKVVDKLISPISGSTLLQKMKAEDEAAVLEYFNSPKTKEIICTSGSNMNIGLLYKRKQNMNIALNNVPSPMNSNHSNAYEREDGRDKLVVVAKKHKGASFFWKLLSRKKKEIIQRKALPVAN